MKNFVLDIVCQTASFRDPNFQNFHKSLRLPPPTTIIGLSGAALGLSPLRAQEFFNESDFCIGVYGTFNGKSTDTWKYVRGIRDMRLYNPNLDGSIIQRELLVEANFIIAFSSENDEAISKLKLAFENPVYALTMGNSDSLAHIRSINIDLLYTEANAIENCIVKGNVIHKVMEKAENGNLEFSVYSNEALLYDLPVRFNYEHDYGRRTISQVDSFSMVGQRMKLNFKLKGITYKNCFIPLFDI